MISLIAKLLGAGSRLSALEGTILDAVKSRLDADLARIWDDQVRAINKVQRLPDGVEVNFYRMKSGRPSFDSDLAFPNKADELPVARVRLKLPNTDVKLGAKIWCVKGFVFSIEYDGSVSYFEEAAGMDPRPEIGIECEITADLGSRVWSKSSTGA